MDIEIKKLILYTSGLEGFLNNQQFYGYEIAKERASLIKTLRKMAQKVAECFINDGEVNKLIAEIQAGKYEVRVISDIDKILNSKRLGKKTVKINYDVLADVVEMACWKVCDDCKGKNKKCNLLKIFKKKLNEIGLSAPCQLEEIENNTNNEII